MKFSNDAMRDVLMFLEENINMRNMEHLVIKEKQHIILI